MPVTVNLAPLDAFDIAVLEGLSKGAAGRAVDTGFKVIGHMYRAWAFQRFVTYSRGGGDWPPLAESTIKRRRHGKGVNVRRKKKRGAKRGKNDRVKFKAGTVAILRDTSTLLGGLDARINPSKGGLEQRIKFGVRLGYGGPAPHPKGKGRATVAQIAAYHQAGGGHLPQRRIIVPPPQAEIKKYAGVMTDALAKEWANATRGK